MRVRVRVGVRVRVRVRVRALAEYKRWEWRGKGYSDKNEERWRQMARERWDKEAGQREEGKDEHE